MRVGVRVRVRVRVRVGSPHGKATCHLENSICFRAFITSPERKNPGVFDQS